ncbi:SprT family zinc-dependent metalloprotease [Paucibacter sp. O1-1]|nr:M48 family metallopeptidase [Paucibacter sp. O1-1]MDA3827327.1 SprT family zinc-dependent metalloprotease [Paucibacter sp. O1-1]
MSMLKRLASLLHVDQLSLFEAESPPPPVIAAPAATLPQARSQRALLLDGHSVGYELRRARRRSIGFTVSAEGLKVSAPRWVSVADIEQALRDKQGWILRKLVEQRERTQRLQAARVVWADGASLPYLGAPLRLRLGGLAQYDAEGRVLHLGLPLSATPEQMRDAVQAWLQRQARALFERRCAHFATALGVRYTRLSLSSAQTRWGSASASGAIRLNWRLIHFAPAIIDYVVAHELAHLREMNHSARFWAVVRSVVPDYEQARERLRDEPVPQLDS